MKILVVCKPPKARPHLRAIEAEPIDIGVVKDELAVHQHMLYAEGFSVTNIKTGLALVWIARTKDEAIRFAGKALKEMGKVGYDEAVRRDRSAFLRLLKAHEKRRAD